MVDKHKDDIQALLDERAKTHGDFSNHAGCAQELKKTIAQWLLNDYKSWYDLPAIQREALDMICHKIGRIVVGNPNTQDHWDDIAGYAKLVSIRLKPPTNRHNPDAPNKVSRIGEHED